MKQMRRGELSARTMLVRFDRRLALRCCTTLRRLTPSADELGQSKNIGEVFDVDGVSFGVGIAAGVVAVASGIIRKHSETRRRKDRERSREHRTQSRDEREKQARMPASERANERVSSFQAVFEWGVSSRLVSSRLPGRNETQRSATRPAPLQCEALASVLASTLTFEVCVDVYAEATATTHRRAVETGPRSTNQTHTHAERRPPLAQKSAMHTAHRHPRARVRVMRCNAMRCTHPRTCTYLEVLGGLEFAAQQVGTLTSGHKNSTEKEKREENTGAMVAQA